MKKVFSFFPGRFSREKCKIYTMFATMCIATILNVAVNVTIEVLKHTDEAGFAELIYNSFTGPMGYLFWMAFYLITQWMPISTIAIIHYKNFKAEAKQEREGMLRRGTALPSILG